MEAETDVWKMDEGVRKVLNSYKVPKNLPLRFFLDIIFSTDPMEVELFLERLGAEREGKC